MPTQAKGKKKQAKSVFDSKVRKFEQVEDGLKGVVFVTKSGHTFRTSKKALKFYAKAYKKMQAEG